MTNKHLNSESGSESSSGIITTLRNATESPSTSAQAALFLPGQSRNAKVKTKRAVFQEASLGQFPWLANLGYVLSGRPDVQFKCGGALIGDRYVVTAAHCVTNLPSNFKL